MGLESGLVSYVALVLVMKMLKMKQVSLVSVEPPLTVMMTLAVVQLLQPAVPDSFLVSFKPGVTAAEMLQVLHMKNMTLMGIKSFPFPLRH